MHTAETQGINTIFIDQWPDYNIFRKYILCWHQNILQLTLQTCKSD